jgi:FKBP-type peptidyl-prolyl cis-trans isomerase
VERIPLLEVRKLDVREGTGEEARVGSTLSLHYEGSLADGKVFESSRDSGKPVTMELAPGKLIPGFVRGIPGMRVGGVRRLKIPSDLAYGRRGNPPRIPADADLTFEVELLDVR